MAATEVITCWTCKCCGLETISLYKSRVNWDILRSRYVETGICEDCHAAQEFLELSPRLPEHDCLRVYQTIFRLDNGDSVKLEYRNSSNGYYGGYLVRKKATR